MSENDDSLTLRTLTDQLRLLAQSQRDHVVECTKIKRDHVKLFERLSDKIDALGVKVERVDQKVKTVGDTVSGWRAVVKGGWTGFFQLMVGVMSAVAAATAALMIQNANLHKETAQKLDTTAAALATTTQASQDQQQKALADRENKIIQLLEHQRH